jgi:hypothetical protein
MDAFAVEILADPAHELFIVMGLPEVHEVVRTLMPTAPVPAARITTLVSDEGEVEVVHAFLRSLPDSASDGAHRIEPADGALAGEKALGRLPHWSAAADLVRRAATLLLPQRTISWDVALTPNGPLVIDAVSDYAWVPGVGFDMVLARLRAVATPAGVAP